MGRPSLGLILLFAVLLLVALALIGFVVLHR
jgi:hypothetical protein